MANHGVGIVVRSIVRNTVIQLQVNVCLRPKTITVLFAAKRRQDSNKRTIVLEVIPVIVPNGGKPKLILLGITIKLRKHFLVPFRSLNRLFSCSPLLQVGVPSLLSDYRQTPFTLQDGYCEWKGSGGLMFLEENHRFLGMLQLTKHSSFWELSSFVLRPETQGKGYGKQMLRHCIQALDDSICLRVKQDNSAKHLYESLGFQTESFSDGRYYMKYLK